MSELKASEALYGFCGWLAGRTEVTEMSTKHDCAVIADLVKEFCDTNNLSEPRDNWHQSLIHPNSIDNGS